MADPVDPDDDDYLYGDDAPTIETSIPFDFAALTAKRKAAVDPGDDPATVQVLAPVIPDLALPTLNQPLPEAPTDVIDLQLPTLPPDQPDGGIMDLHLPTLPPERPVVEVAPIIDLPLPTLPIPIPTAIPTAIPVADLEVPGLSQPTPSGRFGGGAKSAAPSGRFGAGASSAAPSGRFGSGANPAAAGEPMRPAARPPTADENLARRRRPSVEIRPSAELPPLPEKVQVGAPGAFQVVKPILPQPTAPPASWLPPPARPARPVGSLDPPMQGSRSPAPTPSGRFVPVNPGSGPNIVATAPDPTPPAPRARRPLSPAVTQNLAAAGAALFLVLIFVVLGSADGYSSKLYSVEEQAQLGALWKDKGASVWGGPADADVNAAVAAVGQPIATVLADALDGRPVSFLVVKERDVPQAFGLPGGTVVVTAGMLKRLRTEAELAAVLAHSVAHLALGHVDAAIDLAPDSADDVRAALARPTRDLDGNAKKVVSAGVIAVAVAVAEASSSTPHSPRQEASADALALQALETLGHNPRALRTVLVEVLAPVRRQHANWLLQHPDLPTRLNDLDVEAGGRDGAVEHQRLLDKLNTSPPPPARTPAAAGTAAATTDPGKTTTKPASTTKQPKKPKTKTKTTTTP